MTINLISAFRVALAVLILATAAHTIPTQAHAATCLSPSTALQIAPRADSILQIDFDSVAQVPITWRESIRAALTNDRALLPQDTRFTVTAFRADQLWMQSFVVPTRVIETGWEDLGDSDVIEIVGNSDLKFGMQTSAVRGSEKATTLMVKTPKY